MGVLKAVTLLSGLLGCWVYSNLPYLTPLDEIFVVGNAQGMPPGVLDKAVAGVGAKSYFSDVYFLTNRLSGTGWVRSVRVKHQYPGRWWVFYSARQPALRLSGSGMLDDEGGVMAVAVPNSCRKLPIAEVTSDRYKQAYALWKVLKIHDPAMLAKLQLIVYDADEGWVLQFAKNIKLKLGYHLQQQRLSQFLRVLKSWVKTIDDPDQVFDFRYKNGFSHKKES